jgi:hypothetical protein
MLHDCKSKEGQVVDTLMGMRDTHGRPFFGHDAHLCALPTEEMKGWLKQFGPERTREMLITLSEDRTKPFRKEDRRK